MASYTYFFIAASEGRELYADFAKDVEVAMFNLKSRPLVTAKGYVLFDKLVFVEPHLTVKRAEKRLRAFERLSKKKKVALVEENNPNWIDLSAKWHPVHALAIKLPNWIVDTPGESSGGIAAKLQPRVPPLAAEDAVDPCTVMSYEELLASGAYKELVVGKA